MLSLVVFATAVEVVTECPKRGLMIKILCANDLVLMSTNMENLKEKFLKWKEAFESKRLKINLRKTKVMRSYSKKYQKEKSIYVPRARRG